jgi:hypothetical protein
LVVHQLIEGDGLKINKYERNDAEKMRERSTHWMNDCEQGFVKKPILRCCHGHNRLDEHRRFEQQAIDEQQKLVVGNIGFESTRHVVVLMEMCACKNDK